MTTVHKAITEESEHINKVKKIVKEKASQIEKANLKESPLALGRSWKDLAFSHPERTVRLATAFSGIGAIEHAFQRLGLKHTIVFAGDVDLKCKQSYFGTSHCNSHRPVLHLQVRQEDSRHRLVLVRLCGCHEEGARDTWHIHR